MKKLFFLFTLVILFFLIQNSSADVTQIVTGTVVEPFIMTVYSPILSGYGDDLIPFNITMNTETYKLEYKDNNDWPPRWRRLCTNCEEYGFSRKKTKHFSEGQHNISIKATNTTGGIADYNTSFFIDSIAPRIIRTLPTPNTITNGTGFYIKYTEENLKEITINWDNHTEVLSQCNQSGKNVECYIDFIDLSAYDGQYIEYWFTVSDEFRDVNSRKIRIKVDTTLPNLVIYEPQDITYTSRRIPFNITMGEKVDLEYFDHSYWWSVWRPLCRNCDEYGFSWVRRRSFWWGTHNLEIRATDKAGNSVSEIVTFTII